MSLPGVLSRVAAPPLPPEGEPWPPSRWLETLRALRRRRSAVIATGVLVLVIVVSVAAPLYAHLIAHTNPFVPNVSGTTVVNGHRVPIFSTGKNGFAEMPIGPTWTSHYFLGADALGRDVLARTLYGGRTSLVIGGVSALICCALGTLIGLIAGYAGGLVDVVLSRLMDLIWSFPFYFLAVAVSAVLVSRGLNLGIFKITGSSELLPILIIAFIFIPKVGRPIRGLVLSLRDRDFVAASILTGAPGRHVVAREILPNVLPVVVALIPIMMAQTVLTEATLSFLGLGVQPPNASWGTLISDGQQLLYSRPWISLAPGIMLTITLAALGVLGEAVRAEVAGDTSRRILQQGR